MHHAFNNASIVLVYSYYSCDIIHFSITLLAIVILMCAGVSLFLYFNIPYCSSHYKFSVRLMHVLFYFVNLQV